jgi:hypothetical protein
LIFSFTKALQFEFHEYHHLEAQLFELEIVLIIIIIASASFFILLFSFLFSIFARGDVSFVTLEIQLLLFHFIQLFLRLLLEQEDFLLSLSQLQETLIPF